MSPRIHAALPNLAADTLSYYRQIGVEEVTMPSVFSETGNGRPLVPRPQTAAHGSLPAAWEPEELSRIRDTILDHDLEPVCLSLPLSGNIMMGRGDIAGDLNRLSAMVQLAADTGIRVMTYSFNALRASQGYAALHRSGRGKGNLRIFDSTVIESLPPLEDVGSIGMDEMWENLHRFLEAVVPVAEQCGVTLASHPNDPPIPAFREVAQPLYNLEGWKRQIELVNSSSNCLFFDTGVTTELGESPEDVIQYFGKRERIGMVHFRNVTVEIPYYRYTETLIDDGDCDMASCMRSLNAAGYAGGIDPDHTPQLTGDTPDSRQGWAYAIGYMRALRAASISP